jgi:Flp pilus assembly pilin Flp
MMLVFVRLKGEVNAFFTRCSLGALRVVAYGQSMLSREEGQTTAEYALVILAAAAVAVVLIAWAKSSGKLPAFFDKIIDDITADA